MILQGKIPEITIITIGRDKDNEIVLNYPTVSRQHAKLTLCSLNSFIIEDCNSKHGIFIEDSLGKQVRVTRKLVDINDKVWFAGHVFLVKDLLKKITAEEKQSPKIDPFNFTIEFAELQKVYEDYPILRKSCRDRDKMIRVWSIIAASTVGIGSVITGLGALAMLSSAGLSMLVPTLASNFLSTEEKLELIDKEYRGKYRCPNPDCRDPFGNKEFELLAKQKKCTKCKAIWIA